MKTKAVWHGLIFAATILGLVGCGGGGSGGGSSLSGASQDADPVAIDYAIAYIRRRLPRAENSQLEVEDIYEPAAFHAGAALFVRERASSDARETDITSAVFAGDYDVKDISVSRDGSQLLFAMRAPEIENVGDDEQPSWNIWRYDIASETLDRIITSDISAETGDDISPVFLPDGRIVFSSTRQRRSRALLLDDNKPQFSALTEDLSQPAFVLHVMDSDGSNIEQITFNQSHDLQPLVLTDGRILFNRWDNFGSSNSLSLYTVLPDGSGLSRYYGYHSQETGNVGATNLAESGAVEAAFLHPQEMPDGRILVNLRAPEGVEFGGDIVVIDGAQYAEAFSEPEQEGSLVGQQSLAFKDILIDGEISSAGRYNSVYPFYDGTDRLLVSWSLCRLLEPETNLIRPCTDSWLAVEGIEEAEPLYGLWIYNFTDKTQLPIIKGQEGFMVTEGVTMEPRPVATFIPAKIPGIDVDRDLIDDSLGVLHIRSVYDIDGMDSSISGITALSDPAQTLAADRPARFLRVVKAVGIPDRTVQNFDGSAFGRSRNQLMREILGYTPIQPDGSVRVKIPADTAFAISIVDAAGKRIDGRHQNWLQLRAGEVRQCSGCHTRDSEAPHGRADLEAASINWGAPTSNAPFQNTEPALLANMGETMAETMARIVGTPELIGDLEFTDVWTDPLVRAKDVSIDLSYSDLMTPAPITSACQSQWNALCRAVVHYPTHIQPLWLNTRELLDGMGALIEDRTCISCHSPKDAMGQARVPLGQLDLSADQSPTNQSFAVSYVELLFNDNEQEVVDGVLLDRLIQAEDNDGNLLYRRDDLGNLVLDGDGNPIPIMVPIAVASSMSVNGAMNSRFFNVFDAGGTHDGYLDAAEMKLIAEWLDIGAQYYNNPFDAPLN